LFKHAQEISKASHLKKVFERVQAREAGATTRHERGPDLILVDLDMPDVSADLLAEWRAATSEGPTIIVFASHGEEALRGLRAGAEDWVLKPIRPDDLLTRIRLLLEQQQGKTERGMPRLDAPLPHLVENLHDAEDGHLNARQVSDFYGLSV